MQIVIRRAVPEDADVLTSLAMISKQSNGYDDAFMAACADELRVTQELLKQHDYWVADTHAPCGFICLIVEQGTTSGEDDSLFIHPDFQGMGVGRKLWNCIKDEAQRKGLKSLYLEADPFAENFYKKLGFVVSGRVPSISFPDRSLSRMEFSIVRE